MEWKILQALAGSRAKVVAMVIVMVLILIAAFRLTDQPFGLESGEGCQESAAIAFDAAIGATIEPLDHSTAQSLGVPAGEKGLVITSVARDGPAARAGIRTGDVIEWIGGRRIVSFGDATTALNQAQGPKILLMLDRHGRYVTVQLSIGSTMDRASRDVSKQGSER